ncbi:MAG: Mrp/NBP35 family ATP-binding protein [Thermoproteota archaeon]|nr:Mrp/NBP35 family ATP-binding protein [Candidatus Brockarchaeota archaeon]
MNKVGFYLQDPKITEKMGKIKHKIAILSGKGGVGKSMLSLMLSLALAKNKHRGLVGLLDADITGPSIPKMLNLRDKKPTISGETIFPIESEYGIKVMSIDFFLKSDDTPVIWRGPLKSKAITQFLSQVEWGELDFLIIDLPPGTGDEALTVTQTLQGNIDGAIIVTIPSQVSKFVVKKAISFAKELNVPIIGIVENMSGVTCPKCGAFIETFPGKAGEEIAKELNINFLGKVPIDPKLSKSLDKGINLLAEDLETSITVKNLFEISAKVEELVEK